MILGFTGTRHGMTRDQKRVLTSMLQKLKPKEVHHGCCKGADDEFVTLVAAFDGNEDGVKIHAHPSTLKGMTSKESITWSDVIHPKEPPLVRNHHIVDACEMLIACPKEMEEQLRSGTWATVRRARMRGVPVKIILPDGTVEGS